MATTLHTHTLRKPESSRVFLFSCPPSQQISLQKLLCSSHTLEINLSCRQESIFFSSQVLLLPRPFTPPSPARIPPPVHPTITSLQTVRPLPRPATPPPPTRVQLNQLSAPAARTTDRQTNKHLTLSQKTNTSPLSVYAKRKCMSETHMRAHTYTCTSCSSSIYSARAASGGGPCGCFQKVFHHSAAKPGGRSGGAQSG